MLPLKVVLSTTFRGQLMNKQSPFVRERKKKISQAFKNTQMYEGVGSPPDRIEILNIKPEQQKLD